MPTGHLHWAAALLVLADWCTPTPVSRPRPPRPVAASLCTRETCSPAVRTPNLRVPLWLSPIVADPRLKACSGAVTRPAAQEKSPPVIWEECFGIRTLGVTGSGGVGLSLQGVFNPWTPGCLSHSREVSRISFFLLVLSVNVGAQEGDPCPLPWWFKTGLGKVCLVESTR